MQQEIKKKNYRFFFWIILAAVIAFAIPGYYILCALVLPIGMTFVLVFQLQTGYSINQRWEKEYSRKEKPFAYWFIFILNLIVVVFLFYIINLAYT